MKTVFRYLLAFFMVSAGVMHFLRPDLYLRIMPPYLPWHLELVYLSGIAELLLGIFLMIPRCRRWAAWGIIALLIAVFPANVYLYQHQEILPVPSWLHLARLPLQGLLMLWAYWYTREEVQTVPGCPNRDA